MSTEINELVNAVRDEAQLHQGRYQMFAQQAETLGYSQVAKFLRAILAIERIRVELYCKSLADPSTQFDTCDYYVCIKCGLAQTLNAPQECPVCHTPGTQFKRIC